jgi:hypothetical protein
MLVPLAVVLVWNVFVPKLEAAEAGHGWLP